MSEVNVQIQNPNTSVNITEPEIIIQIAENSIEVVFEEGQPISIQVQNPVIEVNMGCCTSGNSSAGHIIQDEGTSLAARAKLNFIGAGVTATDNPGDGSTDVTIPGGGGGGASITDITYADMQTAITDGTLTEGAFYRITDAAGTDLGFVCQAIKTNEITVNGTGGYLNADFQAVGDYGGATIPAAPYYVYYTGASGAFTVGETITGDDNGSTAVIVSDNGSDTLEVSDVTGDWNTETTFLGGTSGSTATLDTYEAGSPEVAAGSQLGIWRTGFETVIINYMNLSGGTFAVGDTITGGTTGATAVIVTDDGASSMTAYMTSAGVALDGLEVLDNGNGVTSDQDGAAGSPTIILGDVVIWNLLHYMLTNDTLLDGTDPATNTAAYTLLDKATYQETYVPAWEVSEFDFTGNLIEYRQDLRGGLVRGNVGVSGYQFGRDDCGGNNIQSPATFDIRNLIAAFNNNTTYPGANVSDLTLGAGTTAENNILENGASLTGITAGANCSISQNKIGQGATLGGTTTIGDGSRLEENEIGPNASIANITANTFGAIVGTYIGSGGSIYGVSLQDLCSISGTNLGVGAEISDVALQSDGVTGGKILYCEFTAGARLSNKTFGESLTFGNTTFGLFSDEIETITENVQNKRGINGFSDIPCTIDITGLTTLDCTAAFAQYRGVYNLTSSNATEAIDTITNPPTAFPFTIRPAAGLVLTITGTAYSGIAAGQIALKATDYTLDGDKGEYIVLEIDPLGTGCLIEKQVVNGLI